MPDREKVMRDFKNCALENGCQNCTADGKYENCVSLWKDVLSLLKGQEVTPSYNDAVDTIKFQSKVIGFACETLAGYESEEPCNTLFYIKEERQKCDERCCSDKTPDEWCWRRYLSLMAMEDNKEDSDVE